MLKVKTPFLSTLNKNAHALADIVYEEQAHDKTLLSPKLKKKQLEHDIKAHKNQMQKKLTDGLKACLHGIAHKDKERSVKKEIQKAFEKIN